MNDEHMDHTFRELQDELTLTPSPEFAAKVRAQIAEQPARGWFTGWRLVAASVAVLGCAALSVVVWQARSRPAALGSPDAVARVELPPAVVERTPPPSSGIPATGRVRMAKVATPPAPRAGRVEPLVLVPGDERAALNRLLAELKDGRAFVPPAENLVDETTGELKLLAIAPLVVDPLPGGPGGGNRRQDR